MKSLLALLALAGALCLLPACGDDDPCSCPSPPQPLAEIVRSFAGEFHVETVRIACFYLAGTDTVFLYDRWIRPEDSGLVVPMDAGNCPDFDEVATRLTDGVRELIYMGIWFPSGTGFIEGMGESDMLRGYAEEADPDLAGATITQAYLHVDLFQSVDWADSYELLYRTVFVGRS